MLLFVRRRKGVADTLDLIFTCARYIYEYLQSTTISLHPNCSVAQSFRILRASLLVSKEIDLCKR